MHWASRRAEAAGDRQQHRPSPEAPAFEHTFSVNHTPVSWPELEQGRQRGSGGSAACRAAGAGADFDSNRSVSGDGVATEPHAPTGILRRPVPLQVPTTFQLVPVRRFDEYVRRWSARE
eukprot:COSAG06_NODE_3050_length_5918_cov_3.943461_4_plen_119_part_00